MHTDSTGPPDAMTVLHRIAPAHRLSGFAVDPIHHLSHLSCATRIDRCKEFQHRLHPRHNAGVATFGFWSLRFGQVLPAI